MTEFELAFTSDHDGSCHVARVPSYAFTAAVEYLLLQGAAGRGEDEILCASVEPAFMDAGDEVIAFAVVAQDGRVIGTIPPTAIAGAASDVWERHLLSKRRSDLAETATYVIRRSTTPAADRAASGIRVIEDPGAAFRYALSVPSIRPLDLTRAVAVGATGTGVCERVFDADVFDSLRRWFLADLEREQMAALHGRLWFTPNDQGDLVPYVLYEDYVPFDGQGSVCSVRIEAAAQGESAGHELPLAAIIHSHPALQRDGGATAGCQAAHDEPAWGPSALSPVDIVQFRRALGHVHQATWVAALPAEPDGIIRLAPYGYGPAGTVQAESGFWIAASAHDLAGRGPRPALSYAQ